MEKTKVTIQFTSLTKLWEFRMAIDANIFEMNMSKIAISCECTKEQIDMALKVYNGKLFESKENAGVASQQHQ